MFVVYISSDEIIVTTEEREQETIAQHFVKEGRHGHDYDRDTTSDPAVFIRNNLQVR